MTAKKRSARSVNGLVRRLVVRDDHNEFFVDLPPGARVTFGPDVPFARGHAAAPDGHDRSYALRVYRGRENSTLAACFPRVLAFREIDIEMAQISMRQRDKAGVEYIVLASLGHGHDVPTHWTVHRRNAPQACWGPAEHVCQSQDEAVAALGQAVAASDRLRGEKTKSDKTW